MISINLLPDVKIQFLKTQKVKYRFISMAVLVSTVAIISVVLMAVYVKGIQKLQFSRAQQAARELSTKLSSDEENTKVVTLQNQLTALNSVNSQKPEISRLFSYLQTIIPGDVALSSVNLDPAAGTITIQAETGSLKSANEFSDTLKHTKFTYKDTSGKTQSSAPFYEVVFASLGKGGGTSGDSASASVSFSVSFKYDSKLFVTDVSDTKLSIPALTSSQINQPSSATTGAGSASESTQNNTPFGPTPSQAPISPTPNVNP